MDKAKIQEIKQRIIKEVERLGYLVDERDIIYDFRANSKYGKFFFVVMKDEIPLLVFEYNSMEESIKQI